jgi:mutator protein MutT
MMQRVVAAVIERNGRYLLCQRPPGKRHAGLWEFPGGKVQEGESDSAAIRRELIEELGVTQSIEPLLIAEHTDESSDFLICFLRTEIDGEPECLEHASIGWFLPREIAELNLAPPDEAFALQNLYKRF